MADQKVKLKRFNGTEQEVLHPETDYDQIVNKPTTFTPSAHSLNSHTDVNASPTDGQVLTWDNTNSLWIAGDGGGGSATVTISATEPTSPAVGDLWWDSTDGNLYIYYDDGDSLQWVAASGGGVATAVDKSDLQNLYIYGKASVAITKGQAIQFAGVQGDHILMKPAVQSEINANPDYMIGIADSDLAINDFGYVIISGRLTLNTTAYDAGNILYYDSAGSTAGALTTTEPTGGTAIIQMAAVSVDGVDNGEFIVRTMLLSREIHEIIGLQGELDDKSDVGHTHDDRYYTETETDTLLSGKSDTGHTHTFASLTSKPTTLSGFGITDGVSTTSAQALDATDAISIVGNTLYLNKANGTSETIDLSLYLDDTNLARIVSGVYVPATQVLRFTRDDASTFDVDASMFFDDTNLVTSVGAGTGISVNQTTGAITVTNTAPDQTVTITGGGATTVSGTYPNFTISSTDNNTVYTHPTYAGDDINLDTGPLSGATVISDLDFNITSDTLGHITDANATYSTRTLTANDLGATRFYNDATLNSSTDTASFISELINDYGCFNNNNVVLKISWSYAGNSDLNTGHSTIGTIELAGCTIETWGGTYKHIRITRPNTGTGLHGVYEYNDQGTSYSPGWREIWTSESDGSGSGLDADLLDGQQGSYYYPASNPNGYTTNVGDITGVTAGSGISGGGTSGTVTISHADTSSQGSVNNSGRTYIQDITLDTYGHITGISSATETVTNTDTNYYLTGVSGSGDGTVTFTRAGLGNLTWNAAHSHSEYLTSLPSHNHDDRYYTESESDGRFGLVGSGSDFANGTLVVTNLTGNDGPSWTIEVTGKGYGSGVIKFQAEGYNYNTASGNYYATAGMNYGRYALSYIKVLSYNGNLAFWWPRIQYWNSFEARVTETSISGIRPNRVTSIINSSEPSSSKKTQINLVQNINNTNIGSQSVNYANNAGTLDSIDSSQFVRSDTDDSFTGNQLLFPTLSLGITNNNTAPSGYGTYFRGNSTHFVFGLTNGNTLYLNYGNTSGAFRTYGTHYHNDVEVGTPWGSSNLTNLNQLSNGPGYVTSSGVTSVTSGDSFILMGGSSTAPTVNISSTTGSYLVPLMSNLSTSRVTGTSFTNLGSQTLTGNRTYKVSVSGHYTVTYAGTSFVPYIGLFFSSPTYISLDGVIEMTKTTAGTSSYIVPLYTVSTLVSGSSGAWTTGAYHPSTSSTRYPFYIEATVGVGPTTPTIYVGGKISAAGGGGGFQIDSGTRMVIQRIS